MDKLPRQSRCPKFVGVAASQNLDSLSTATGSDAARRFVDDLDVIGERLNHSRQAKSASSLRARKAAAHRLDNSSSPRRGNAECSDSGHPKGRFQQGNGVGPRFPLQVPLTLRHVHSVQYQSRGEGLRRSNFSAN